MVPPAFHPGFKVLSKVVDLDNPQTIASSMTILCHSRAWDWSVEKPFEVVQLDLLAKQVVLVDLTAKRSARVAFDELDELHDQYC